MGAARFLLDRSLGQRKLVARLRDAGWEATTLAELFGDDRAQRMSDQEWISEGTQRGFVLMAKDHRVASRPLEARAIYMSDARVVAYARGDLTADQMGDPCMKYSTGIHRLAAVQAPFFFSLAQHGLRRKRLNWPI